MGTFVQAGGGIVRTGGAPFVVMARLSFRSFCVMYSACFLWYSSSASGLVASDVLLEDLCVATLSRHGASSFAYDPRLQGYLNSFF